MAFWTTWIFLLPIIFNGQESKAQDCGVAPLNTKIVGGAGAAAGSWPWQVSMHYNPAASHICGGTLISDQWVLTATHCMISLRLSDWTLYMGRQTQIGSNPNEVTRSVSQIIVHPDYNNTFLNNDIALMKLSSPVSFTSYIRPICLAGNSSLFHSATSCWATGWGNIGKDVPLGSPQTLQEVEVPVVGNNQCSCQYILVEGANITDNMICAGRENKGACQGDSGGPVQCKQGSVWIQAGITSFGIPCALANFSEVYARVSQFQTWITDHVAGANVGFRTFTSSGTDQDNSFVCRNTDSGTATTAATTTAATTTAATTTAATTTAATTTAATTTAATTTAATTTAATTTASSAAGVGLQSSLFALILTMFL